MLCWLVYACSYIGKLNYAANINSIMDFYKVGHAEAGAVSTFFFFAYGVGQVVNGLLCKKYNIQWIIFFSLLLSGTANLIVGVSTNFSVVKYMWLVNGFSMSILWPSLIRLLSETLSKKDMAKASGIITHNPVALIKFKRAERQSRESLSKGEIVAFLERIKEPKYDEIRQFAYILYFFGMRPCEIDEETHREGDFFITRNRKRKNGKIEYKKIPIPTQAQELIDWDNL